ncbi:hypothetical protein [Aquimarina mytili]|uniref:Uncharacterized protein n=1 Tax=Aquimarina mytili TaxID=874423 RepID=A0A937A5B1_9FLAO|nr:hypothetical protein [Aquimarina mytili]MBL0684589.1 hypothetical protein [Aquimarina mytili]
MLNISNYAMGVFDFYLSDEKTSIALEEMDTSEQKEKENSEKEDFKEKDKITQDFDEKPMAIVDLIFKSYPDCYARNSSVYLEHKTPPPKYS